MMSLLLTAFFLGPVDPPSSEWVDFDTQVLPILTKAGCNAASCHGAAAGRGGFKLSLFAQDPALDHRAIVWDVAGRRVNLVRPEDSLLLAKPTGMLDHGGEVRLEYDGEQAAVIARWIREGAKRRKLRRLSRLEIQPASSIDVGSVASEPVSTKPVSSKQVSSESGLGMSGGSASFQVIAIYDDATRQDVSSQCTVTPDDPAALAIGDGPHEKITVLVRRGGRHNVVVRYLSQVASVQFTAPLGDKTVDLSGAPRANWIDDEILDVLSKLRLQPTSPVSPPQLLRRLRLDLTGRLPTIEEAKHTPTEFSAQRWQDEVDRLLRSPEFNDYWTFQFAKLLRIRSAPQDKQGARAYHGWLKNNIETNASLADAAEAMLTASGDTHEIGPANFYRAAGDARAQAEFFSEALMGVRMRCANCHNHPLDQWTQDDYHGLAAVFAPVETGQVIRISPRRTVTHPKTGTAATPRLPGWRFLPVGVDSRGELADWLTSADNPYFARAMVNRVWKQLMGRGLIEPVDDIRATNPPSHPRLLSRLANDFAANGFDLRSLIRLIVSSAAYQRSGPSPDSDISGQRYYQSAIAKPLEAEVLADAIAHVTGVWEKYGNQPPGTRAVALFDSRTPSRSLDILGRCSREDSCDTSAGPQGGGLSTTLHLLNGELINDKITSPKSRLHRMIQAGKTDTEIVEELYLQALSRRPTPRELTFWNQELKSSSREESSKRREDFLWSLLNSKEFVMNN